MSQLLAGTVYVQNGQQAVFGSWSASISGITGGPYTVGEAITFSGGATGLLISQAGTVATFIVLTGAPTSGETLDGDASGASGTITGPDPQTDWVTRSRQSGEVFVADAQAGVTYTVSTVDAEDQLTLAANFGGTTTIGSGYSLNDSFTTNRSYPRIEPNDLHSAAKYTRAIDLVDADWAAPSWTSLTLVGGYAAVGGFDVPGYWKDPRGIVYLRGAASHASATLLGTLPVGWRPAVTKRFGAAEASGVGTDILEVLSDGSVQLTGANSNGVSLDGIRYEAA